MYDIFKYFTIINLWLVTIHVINPKYDMFNIHITCLFTFVYGIYITYYLKSLRGRLDTIGLDFTVSGNSLRAFDVMFHFIPFIYVWTYIKFEPNYMINTLFLISMYYILVDVKETYDIRNEYHFRLLTILVILIIMMYCFINKHVC